MTWASWSLDAVGIKQISSFGQIAQCLERVHGKHEVVGSNPTRANIIYKSFIRLLLYNKGLVWFIVVVTEALWLAL